MKIQLNSKTRREAGYVALFITLVLVGAAALVLGATLNRSSSSTRLNDRNCLYISGNAAAEAAVEKVLSRVMVDYANGGESAVMQYSNSYCTSLLPASSESSYWTNFTFSDGLGHNNRIYFARTSTNSNPPFVALEEQYQGLSGFASTWRILANVSPNNSTYSYSFTNAVQQDIQLAEIPIFQFAIFYNSLLEFSDTAPLTVNGRVNANSNIYVGSPSDLTFNYLVTCTGNISAPANDGYSTRSWTGDVNYTPSPGNPGYLVGQPAMTLPIGTNNTAAAVHEIVNLPLTGDNTAMTQQRYYNKAGLCILVYDNPAITNNVLLWSGFGDMSPIYTNLNSVTNFLSTNTSLYDDRENKTMKLTQIDIGKLTNWMVKSTNFLWQKWPTNNPLGIIYVADFRGTNNTTNAAIRLINGTNLPSSGLTIATPNPMYIQGIYNCPNSSFRGTTNTTASAPASVICDALTILSPSWSDSTSFGAGIPTASSDTVNSAIIAGIVYSTGTTSSTFSGGVENFPRLLEDWSSATLTLNSSMICLYPSYWATHQFENPGNYYYAPAQRNFNFDQNYQYANKLPPGTPYVDRMIRATWSNPPPGTTSYTPSPTLDFVAQ